MGKKYVLDTSAFFTLTRGEEGNEQVERILQDAKRKSCSVYVSFMTLAELYYVTWHMQGEDAAQKMAGLMNGLPVEYVHSNNQLSLSAGRIKATHKLSLADAFIAATAIEKQAILIHKDPELEPMAKYVETVQLPYKKIS